MLRVGSKLFFILLPLFFACLHARTVAADGEMRIDQVEFQTTEDGLTEQTFDLELDAQGFLWLATGTYPLRYDGYRFETFKHDPEDPASPVSGTAWVMCRSRGGGMWFGTQEGVVMRYEPATDRFVNYLPDTQDPRRLPELQVWALAEDEQGQLWVASQGREPEIGRLDPATGEVTRYRHDPEKADSLGPGQVWDVLEDRQGTVWIATASGLDRFVAGTGSFVHYPWPGLGRLFEDSRGRLWATFIDDEREVPRRDGLLRFDRQHGTFEHFALPPSWDAASIEIRRISEDRQGVLWLPTTHGAVRFDPRSSTFSRFRQATAGHRDLATAELYDILEDRSGVLWFATKNIGLARLDRRRERFEIHRLAPPGSGGLEGGGVCTLEAGKDGTLWIGTDAGLYALDRTNGEIEAFRTAPEAGPNRLPGQGEVRSILQDRQGTLWVTTDFGGIVRRPAGAERFERIADSALYYPFLFADTGGTVWVPNWNDGVHRFDPATSRLQRWLGYKETAEIRSMHEDSGGELWLLTMRDVIRIGKANGELDIEHHSPEANSPTSQFVDLHEDQEGIFWLATKAGGFFRWDRPKDRWQVYGEGDGLASNHVAGILADDAGMLWLATRAGLSRFDPRTESFRTFTTAWPRASSPSEAREG